MILAFTLGCYTSSSKYKEPNYNLIKKINNIEFREYKSNIIIKTSKLESNNKENNSLFRILANYIFGGNKNNEQIPMTAPVLTHYSNNNYEMIFFILNKNSIDELPKPNNKNIKLDNLNLNKTISISFGMWANNNRINYYKNKLDKFIEDNSINVDSNIIIAQYNSPWVLPPFRRNELIYKLKGI
tara:strand:- start:1065 stop:1619 length:555 start_codon:yes stop_codon:yes gene_type:complete